MPLSVSFHFPIILAFSVLLLLTGSSSSKAQENDSPRFIVPGFEKEMETLDQLRSLHEPHAFTNCTLWDAWLPHSTLWTGREARQKYRQALLQRRIDEQGYVSMQQHRGMAHSEGWPFPAWQQSTGRGWHFSTLHDPWAVQIFKLQPLRSLEGWDIAGAEVAGFDEARGLMLNVDEKMVRITTPAFRCGTIVAPFVRLEWATHQLPDEATAEIEWKLEGEDHWKCGRTLPVSLPDSPGVMQYENVPLYQYPDYQGLVTQFRVTIHQAKGSTIDLKSLITAVDTRHPITGSMFVTASSDYFHWTQDVEFLQNNIERMRRAMQFTREEFQVDERHHVYVPWVGHSGRSGIARDDQGNKQLKPGVGVGNNYWDLLPFGGHDALATIYLYDAIQNLAKVETALHQHPEWGIPTPEKRQSHQALTSLAEQIRQDFQERFWNPETRRFYGWIDRDGKGYDYGFTFVNLEAITYGLASQQQAEAILAWIDGERTIENDTSQGDDIYHWRFAPRATTRRNIDTYAWVWSTPESIPWGGQVQDGGAVLGFSYFDLMARLKTKGADDAWSRLQTILDWFNEVQREGGYRAYYSQPGRGSLQGGGTAGGLGLDKEFMESILVPQIMLYGFLGFEPNADGFEVNPRLPSDWPSLTVRGIHIHDRIVDITATAEGDVTVVDVKQ